MAEYTQEEIEAREELLEVMMEQARTGQKGIDLDIQRYLQYTKSGKAITEATKATETLTGGFKESAKALGSSTGNFTDLTAAVTGTINAVSGLLSSIPIVGKAFAALGDAAAETATFAIGQVQANYESFKELAKAGQIGADGVSGMADRFDKAGIPLATYTKLLSSHSEELAYFSSSALSGGKNFANMIANMDEDSKQYMRNLGLGIEQIGDAAIEYQVLQRKRGILTDMDNMQLSKGTAHYVEELNMMAKLTGQNVDDLKKQRDEVRADSRFRARLAALRAKGNKDGAEQLENFAAMMMKINPEIGKGFTDITSGAINTEAALKLTRSGMLDTAKEVQRGLETGKIDKAQAISMIIDAAKEASKYGGTMQSLAGLSEEAAAKFLNYAGTLDTANMSQKKLTAIEKEMAKTKSKPDATTNKLSTSMAKLEKTIATVNEFFIATPAATATIGFFADTMLEAVTVIREKVLGEDKHTLAGGRPATTAMTTKQMKTSENAAASRVKKDQLAKLKVMRQTLENLDKTEAEIAEQLNYARAAMGLPPITGKQATPVTAKTTPVNQPAKPVTPQTAAALAGPDTKPAEKVNYGAKIADIQGAKALATNEMINFEAQARKSNGIDASERAELKTIAEGIVRMNKELINLRELARQQNSKIDKGNKIASNNG